ncbi:MAG: endonuclease III domain-containing protein [Desulfovibrionaceae bacterium]
MLAALGPSHWWPGETPFEVLVGAVLTQNTNWGNVERAIANLKAAGVLDPHAMYALPPAELSELIRPAGYFRVKAGRLRNVLAWLLEQCDGDMAGLAERDLAELRPSILEVKGVGPETADSILLYALNLPTFVVDAYTFRILGRHGLVAEDADYHALRAEFMDHLPEEAPLFNEYHALLVRVGKDFCRKRQPRCDACPLSPFLP